MREFSGTTPDRRVAELALGQWGVVSVAQLRALGLDKDAVQRRERAGRLHRLHRGVYAVGQTVLRSEGRRLAAVLACGDGAVLRGLSDVLCEVGVTDSALWAGKGHLVLSEDEVH
jgi:hypothetical protein